MGKGEVRRKMLGCENKHEVIILITLICVGVWTDHAAQSVLNHAGNTGLGRVCAHPPLPQQEAGGQASQPLAELETRS